MNKFSFRYYLKHLKQPWEPFVLGVFNRHTIKLTYFKGIFHKHYHDTGDEVFVVIRGVINMGISNKNVILHVGDSYIVKRNEIHEPRSIKGAYVMTIEPEGTDPIFVD